MSPSRRSSRLSGGGPDASDEDGDEALDEFEVSPRWSQLEDLPTSGGCREHSEHDALTTRMVWLCMRQ